MTPIGGELLGQESGHALKCEIAAETLRSFGGLRLRLTGHSMLPAIWPGDTVEIEQRSFADIVPGDVVLYCRQRRLFAHRVLRTIDSKEGTRLIVRGDALPEPDAPVFPAEVLGCVTEIVRSDQSVHPLAIPTLRTRCVARILRLSATFSRLLVHLRISCSNSAKRERLCQV